MKKLVSIFLFTLILAGAACTGRDAGTAALRLAMRDHQIESVRDLKHRGGGLREQVDELFFRASPEEMKEVLSKAGFILDKSVLERVQTSPGFQELAGSANRSGAIGFRRADLTIKDGKYCDLVCAEDFSWAYLIYVDAGKS